MLYFPGVQSTQSSASELPASAYLPASQLVHSSFEAAPVVFKNVPTGQSMQSTSSSLPGVSRYLPGKIQHRLAMENAKGIAPIQKHHTKPIHYGKC